MIVVGLNDIKKAYRGLQFTASAFRSELDAYEISPYLPCISPTSTSPHISPLYLFYISPASAQYLRRAPSAVN